MTDRATHWHRTRKCAVFPEGEKPADIEPLPVGYWEAKDKAERIAAIKAEAQAKIYAIVPLWRQSNDAIALNAGPLHREYAAAVSRRKQIDAIRDWSNAEEAKLK